MRVQDRGHSSYFNRARGRRLLVQSSSSRSKIFYFHRLYGISQFELEDFGVKVKLRLEHALDILGLAKAVLLAFESQISDRQAFRTHGFHHFFGLIGWDDFILQTLEENHRTSEAVGEVNRRTFEVKIAPLGIGADQSIEIA